VAPPPLSEDAYDLCVRFGPPPDARVISKFIAKNRRIVCASAAYLKRYGEPKSPLDLVKHNCIGIRQGDEYGVWRFSHIRNRRNEQAVRIRGNLTTNDGGVAVNWALEGRGLLLRAEWEILSYVRNGKLMQLLSKYRTPDADIYVVYPQQHRSSTRVKAFVEFFSTWFHAGGTPSTQRAV
jgi:LysR family transcriptional regulator, transcriptional activator for dmlA